jgi:predicted RNase H-like HicB family nuclease
MTYKVALRRTDEGYSVSCPGLPGCWSQGDSEEEALDNTREAIREYLAAAERYCPRPGLTVEQFKKLL